MNIDFFITFTTVVIHRSLKKLDEALGKIGCKR